MAHPHKKGSVLDARQAFVRDPSILVIFGATGDLTQRKLIPALYNLHAKKALPAESVILAVARREKTEDQWRCEVIAALGKNPPKDAAQFAARFYYHQTDFGDHEGIRQLKKRLAMLSKIHGTRGNIAFYLATAPEYFGSITRELKRHGLVKKSGRSWQRCVFEKPFGHDLKSARLLNKTIRRVFDESQIFRLDHYLGKDAVQNLLAVRFANGIFEPLWNSKYIDHVQITVSEQLGVELRGGYYDQSGALRDMVQNHLMQLLMFVAMEEPAERTASAIHDEKNKVLRAIAIPTSASIRKNFVRGQYKAGKVAGKASIGYKQEDRVDAKSTTETFVAARIDIHNKRWDGVPFYVRTGKRLPKRESTITISFKPTANSLFYDQELQHNQLVIRVQPEEGTALQFNVKTPDSDFTIRPVDMDFCHSCLFGPNTPEAYERLLRDVLDGNSMLFTRWDEVERAWVLIDPILKYWKKSKNLETYSAGSWGPKSSQQLIERDGRSWT